MFNPSAVSKKGTIFGFPYTQEESDFILLPVHLDVTVSYRQGTSEAPDLILNESSQLDLSLPSIKQPWKLKTALSNRIIDFHENKRHRDKAIKIIKALEKGQEPEKNQIDIVNEYCRQIHQKIEILATSLLNAGKFVGIIGGDHSSPLGLMKALAKRQSFGILQIDAHKDLREAYEMFEFSHASIMFNALKEPGIHSITQVGIRDFCEEEERVVQHTKKPIAVFLDETVYKERMEGQHWTTIVRRIIDSLPDDVYISFDMDGLDASLCPNTGTPVPGGLQFNDAIYLLEQVVKSGKKIIGFDVCETGNAIWDANVASRILYRITSLAGVSNNLLLLT